ncbi:hypothetical protein [Bacillus sp. CRB-7]|nr:hypothetical protein [Bacillus sp. CRB-7]UBM53204.1 hypothetical protein K8M08_27165 [Bacillus sp. CRB-7]
MATKKKNFTSHSLRGGYGHARTNEYAALKATPGGIDSAIQQKLRSNLVY